MSPTTEMQPDVEEKQSSGFDFDECVETVSIEVDAKARRNGVIVEEKVTHLFRMPTAKEIDKYRSLLSQVKGRRVKTDYARAANFLWAKCIIEVRDYVKLPEKWKEFFLADPRAQVHVQSAIEGLIEVAIPDAEESGN